MKLNGCNIISMGSLRDNWSLPELYDNMDNGTYRQFLYDYAGKSETTTATLAALDIKNGDSPLPPGLLTDGKLSISGRLDILQTSEYGNAYKGREFVDSNKSNILRLAVPYAEKCHAKQAGELYLFLLINLHAFSENAIPDEHLSFIEKRLAALKNEPIDTVCGKRAALTQTSDIVYYLRGGHLIGYEHRQKKQYTPIDSGKLAGFAYSDVLGLIAFDRDGCLLPGTRRDIADLVPDGRRVAMASAYGDNFMLLLDDGRVVTNMKLDLSEWKELCWINVGLNSVVGIKKSWHGVIQAGSDIRLSDHTDVASIHTRSTAGLKRFIVLKTDGSVLTDSGEQANSATAANLCAGGYVYSVYDEASGLSRVTMLPFAEDGPRMQAEVKGTITEIHADKETAACLIADTQNDEPRLEVLRLST